MKSREITVGKYIRENRRTVVICLIVTCLLFIVLCMAEAGENSIYIEDESGGVAALRAADGRSVSAAMRVTGFRDGVSVSRNKVVSVGGDDNREESEAEEEVSDTEDSILRSIDEAVRQVERSDDGRIELPTITEDGTIILWEKSDSREKYMVFLMLPALLCFFYKGEKEKDAKRAREKKDSVLRALPSFNSQILLLLGSGLIFEEAFARVAEGYEAKRDRNYFEDMVVEMRRRSIESNVSAARVMDALSPEIGVREFTRIKEIIVTAHYKGNDLSEKLADEGNLLWSRRKKAAEEKGKIAETKLSGPLALLLLALIGVTAAPAIMQM